MDETIMLKKAKLEAIQDIIFEFLDNTYIENATAYKLGLKLCDFAETSYDVLNVQYLRTDELIKLHNDGYDVNNLLRERERGLI